MEFEKQLQGLMTLQDPGTRFTDKVLASLRARVNGRSKARSRFVVIGVTAVVSAAAAMLGWQLTRPTEQPAVAEVSTPVTAPPAEPELSDPNVDVVAEVAAPDATKEVAAPPLPSPPQFTVRVLPPHKSTVEPGKRAVASTYVAFVELLRKIPGVRLLETDLTGSAPEEQPDYRLAITSNGPGQDNKFVVTLHSESLGPDGRVGGNFTLQYKVNGMTRCVSPAPVDGLESGSYSCADPVGIATSMVGSLRMMVFPPDPLVGRQLQARLLNRSLDAPLRLRALSDLASFERYAKDRNSAVGSGLLRDPAVIRGAIDLATTATDPTVRMGIWETLRGTDNKDLILPLIDALDKDPDSEVRLAAMGTLSGEFREDPQVQAALNATARRDARPLVRALAQRAASGLTGETAWREYVLASLKDTSRPAVERIEALFVQMELPISRAYGIGMRSPSLSVLNHLDQDAIKALADALPKAATDSSIIRETANMVVNSLGELEHPAVTDMLVTSLEAGSKWLDRGTAIYALAAASRRNDPRVQAALEKISTSDRDPAVQRNARVALQEESVAVAAPGAGISRGLGVYVSPLEAGPYVPKELIGKSVVSRVESGSAGQEAGVKEGDLLLEINGTPIPSGRELYKILETVPRGVDVDVVVYRFGETVKLKARL